MVTYGSYCYDHLCNLTRFFFLVKWLVTMIMKIFDLFFFLGIFVLNLACRDSTLRSEIISDVQKVFTTVWSYKVPEEVNEILFCTDHEWALKTKKVDRKHPAIEAFDKVNTHTKGLQKSCNARNEEELLDLEEAIKQLKLEK